MSTSSDGATRSRRRHWPVVGLLVVLTLALYGGIGYALYVLVDSLV